MDLLIKERLEIVEQIRDIHVKQSQSLRHVKVSDHTLKLAKSFVKKAPNVCVVESRRSVCLRYEILYSFLAGSEFGVYHLLAEDAKDTPVELADSKFEQWLAAVGSLLRYALNLLLAPKRPEFQTIKLFSSFYVYEIAEKLAEAERILIAMGYCRPTPSVQDTELRIKGEVDLNRVVETAADLVILQCDLEFLRGNARVLAKDHSEFQIRVSDILLARSMPDQIYQDTYEGAIAMASNRQCLPPAVSVGKERIKYPPRMASSDCFEDMGTEAHAFVKNQYSSRSKSSDGALDQTVPVHGQGWDLDDHRGQGSLARNASMPQEHSWEQGFKSAPRQSVLAEGKKELRENSVNSPISMDSSMRISYSQDTPRPNPDDLPDPMFNDEEGFAAGSGHYPPPLRHVSSGDASCGGNRAALYVNSSSAYDDPLDMLVFSPDNNHGKCFQGNAGPEGVEAHGPESNDPATTNISKTMLGSRRQQFAKHSSANGAVEVSHQNAPDFGHDTPPDDISKDSIGSEGRKSLSSPLNSIGEKRKRDTSFEDAPPKTSPHTSIDEGIGDSKASCESLEKRENGNTEEGQRQRANHISEKSREDYKQPGPGEEGPADGRSSSNLKDQWVCDYCTFINPKNVSVCEVCEIPHKNA